jgi:hypothetical protein
MSNEYFVEPGAAFTRAIQNGTLSDSPSDPFYVSNYMYMYSLDGRDFFKHIDTREYVATA